MVEGKLLELEGTVLVLEGTVLVFEGEADELPLLGGKVVVPHPLAGSNSGLKGREFLKILLVCREEAHFPSCTRYDFFKK